MRRTLWLVCGCIGTIGVTLAAETSAEPPPEPEFPDRTAMNDEEFERARERWRREHAAWEAGLTIEQLLAVQAREDDEDELDEAERARREERSRRQRLPIPVDGYDWRQQAAAAQFDPAIIAALERDQMAFGGSRLQSFQPYLSGPVFITSDSLLNAFHVLFEDSFRELELRRAESFRADFEKLLAFVRKIPPEHDVMTPERFAPALAQVERVLGPALVLMGAPLEDFSSSVRGDIAAEVERIRRAEDVHLPSWLAPADEGTLMAIDFGRCKPVGFYAASPRLAEYFRALRWLQLVPFRAAREHEFDAMVLLAVAGQESAVGDRLDSMTRLLGPRDDPTATDIQRALGYSFHAAHYDQRQQSVRIRLVRSLIDRGFYQINSDFRRQATVADTFAQLTFRVISAAALPDAMALQRLMDRRLQPSGLAVAALLGSPFARERLAAGERASIEQLRPVLLPEVVPGRHRDHDARVYPRYLDMLEALFLPVPDAAPPFMKADAWSAKSCQTALGGWAQMRHTCTLQAKMSALFLGLVTVPPGFVEPNPEFFARFARLIDDTIDALTEERCFQPSSWEEAAALRELMAFLHESRFDEVLSANELLGEFDAYETLMAAAAASDLPDIDEFQLGDGDFQAQRKAMISALEQKAETYERDGAPLQPKPSELLPRWNILARTARTLEALAHKQLRGEPWTNAEEMFLKDYGEAMAGVMGYFGNSWLDPRDDAPRWVEVCGFPPRGTSLAAAVGRPRVIYVLYPWQGIDVLCVGSVMQYYEYETSERLTDVQWRDRLDSPSAPAIPDWFAPYAGPPGEPRAKHE